MKCLTVNKCCCGCSLRQGSIFTGVAFGVLSLLQTVGIGSVADHLAKENGGMNGDAAIFTGGTIVWACFTIANLLLIVGATQEITCLLILWMVSHTINLLVYVGLYAYLGYEMSTHDNAGMSVVMIILCTLVLVALFCYSILVVYSYYLIIISSQAVIEEPPSQPDPNARRWR